MNRDVRGQVSYDLTIGPSPYGGGEIFVTGCFVDVLGPCWCTCRGERAAVDDLIARVEAMIAGRTGCLPVCAKREDRQQ